MKKVTQNVDSIPRELQLLINECVKDKSVDELISARNVYSFHAKDFIDEIKAIDMALVKIRKKPRYSKAKEFKGYINHSD